MPTRELLSPAQRAQMLRLPDGKFTQGWADFALKDGNLTGIMGIGIRYPGNVAPDLASCTNIL